MPDPTPRQPGADRNLLFGVLALQMEFISRDELIAAMQDWVSDQTRMLGQILVERGWLTPGRRQLLDDLVQEHINDHHGDAVQSLAALPALSCLRGELVRLADENLRAT